MLAGCYKDTTLTLKADGKAGYILQWEQVEGNSMYLPVNFSVNLKQFLKTNSIN